MESSCKDPCGSPVAFFINPKSLLLTSLFKLVSVFQMIYLVLTWVSSWVMYPGDLVGSLLSSHRQEVTHLCLGGSSEVTVI